MPLAPKMPGINWIFFTASPCLKPQRLRAFLIGWLLDSIISSQITTFLTTKDPTYFFTNDNLVNRKLAVKILGEYGHKVGIAENGSLAVDAYKARGAQGKPFVILFMMYRSWVTQRL